MALLWSFVWQTFLAYDNFSKYLVLFLDAIQAIVFYSASNFSEVAVKYIVSADISCALVLWMRLEINPKSLTRQKQSTVNSRKGPEGVWDCLNDHTQTQTEAAPRLSVHFQWLIS